VDVVHSKMRSKLVACGALVLAVASTAPAGAGGRRTAEIRAFRPVADTYVSAAQPRRNFGRTRVLRADGSPVQTVYLKFRIKQVKGDLADVTLLLHAQAGARTTYQVRRVREDEWREGRLTYENAPRLSLRYASSKPVRRGAWSAVDVTPFIANEDDEVSLAITTKSARGVVFASRESRRGPRLVLRTEEQGSEEPPPPPGP
jgi:hypothetical protein